MLQRYREVIAHIPAADALHAAALLNIAPVSGARLYEALERASYGQADLVLALLRAGRHRSVELLLGKPITVCPPQATPARCLPLPRRAPGPDDRRVRVLVKGNPLVHPTARSRLEELRKCYTVRGYLSRYPTWRARRDLREWSRAGWVEVEEMAS